MVGLLAGSHLTKSLSSRFSPELGAVVTNDWCVMFTTMLVKLCLFTAIVCNYLQVPAYWFPVLTMENILVKLKTSLAQSENMSTLYRILVD